MIPPGDQAYKQVSAELVGGCRRRVTQERDAPLGLVLLFDQRRSLAQRRERAQEAPVRLVLPRDGAVALPAVAAEQVQGAVVAGPRVGVSLDGAAVREGTLGEDGPGQR